MNTREHTQTQDVWATDLYLKPIVLLHVKLRHLHTGFQVNLTVQVVFLYKKHTGTIQSSLTLVFVMNTSLIETEQTPGNISMNRNKEN